MSGGLFHVGQQAPSLDADGIIRDGALGGIGPDIMARGLGKILPGITVTP